MRSGRNKGTNKYSLRRSSSNKVRVSPTPLREGLRGGRTEAVVAQAHTEVTERCKKSAKKMAEELSKLQQIHAHLAALEQMAASYLENHSTRLAIESLELYKARTVVERHREA